MATESTMPSTAWWRGDMEMCDAPKAKLTAAQRSAAYRKENREKIAVKKAAYYKANREKISVQQAAYRRANREKYNAYHRAYRARQKKAATGRSRTDDSQSAGVLPNTPRITEIGGKIKCPL